MLFVVQSVQIARALTTYESMRSHAHRSSPAAEAITAAITAGTTSLSSASLTNTGVGPDPAVLSGPHATAHPHKEDVLLSGRSYWVSIRLLRQLREGAAVGNGEIRFQEVLSRIAEIFGSTRLLILDDERMVQRC